MEIINSTLSQFFQQIEFRFQQGYQRRKTYWQNYAEEIPSTTKQNVYSWLAELPGLRKWVGPKLARNIAARAVALINDDYEDTMEIDRNDLDDDIWGVYGRKAELMGDAGSRWGDDLVTSAMINGTTTLCFDGQNFFDTAHPVDVDDSTQGTYQNLFTSKALNQTNFNYVYSQMQSVKGESGKPLEVTPTLLVVPPSLREIAYEICKASLIKQLATNVAGSENVGAAAASNINMGEVTPLVVPRLVDDTANAWYLLSTDRLKPFMFQVRKQVTPVLMIDPQNPIVFNQRKLHWGLEARGAAGVTLPFLAAKATP